NLGARGRWVSGSGGTVVLARAGDPGAFAVRPPILPLDTSASIRRPLDRWRSADFNDGISSVRDFCQRVFGAGCRAPYFASVFGNRGFTIPGALSGRYTRHHERSRDALFPAEYVVAYWSASLDDAGGHFADCLRY